MTPQPDENLSKHARRKVRYLLIQSFLRENRAIQALDTLNDILVECPHDPEALMILGVLFSAAVSERIEHHPLSTQALYRLMEHFQSLADSEQRAASSAAAGLLDRIAEADRMVGENNMLTDDVRRLMPALIERNIRQAQASGESDLAEALRSLEISLSRHNH